MSIIFKSFSRKETTFQHSCYIVEIYKSIDTLSNFSNNTMFKIVGDVHNCNSYWEILIWSKNTYEWKTLATASDIPNLRHSIDYCNCSKEIFDKNRNIIGYCPSDEFLANMATMKTFMENFYTELCKNQ